jgi:hypothetical protein
VVSPLALLGRHCRVVGPRQNLSHFRCHVPAVTLVSIGCFGVGASLQKSKLWTLRRWSGTGRKGVKEMTIHIVVKHDQDLFFDDL